MARVEAVTLTLLFADAEAAAAAVDMSEDLVTAHGGRARGTNRRRRADARVLQRALHTFVRGRDPSGRAPAPCANRPPLRGRGT